MNLYFSSFSIKTINIEGKKILTLHLNYYYYYYLIAF